MINEDLKLILKGIRSKVQHCQMSKLLVDFPRYFNENIKGNNDITKDETLDKIIKYTWHSNK